MLPKPPSPRPVGKGVDLLKFHRQKRQQHELGDAVTVAHGALFVAVVVQGDEAFAAVVTVDDAEAVCRTEALLGS